MNRAQLSLIGLGMVALLAYASAGCKGGASTPTQPTPITVTQTAAPTPAASCAPFDLQWFHDMDMSGPIALIQVNLVPAGAISRLELDEQQGNGVWQAFATVERAISWNIHVHFDHTYRVRASVAGCWSTYYQFRVGPPNPTGDGDPDGFGVETPFVFVGGNHLDLPVSVPPGRYRLQVITYDRTHLQYDQSSQDQEQIEIGGVGVTVDIPTNATHAVTTYTITGPLTNLSLTSIRDSVHGALFTFTPIP